MTETLKELIATWRHEARKCARNCVTQRGDGQIANSGFCLAFAECADQLESALAGIARPSLSEKAIPDYVCGICYHPFDACSHCEQTTRPSGAEGTEQGAGSRPLPLIE